MPSSCGSEVCGAAFLQAPSARHSVKKENRKTRERGAVDLLREQERVIVPSRPGCGASLHDFKTKLFDHQVSQNFFGDFLHLGLRFIAAPAIEIQHKKLALAHVRDRGVAQTGERVLNGLTLWIENGAFWHHPYVRFHGASITLG